MKTGSTRAVLVTLAVMLTCGPLFSSPVKPAISMEIKGPGKPVQPGPLTVRVEITAKTPVSAVNVKACLDKIPVQTSPQLPLPMNRGDRRSVDVFLQIVDKKAHWFFAEAEITLVTGERWSIMKSLVINASKSGKNARPDPTYETYRAEKPHK